MGISVQLVGRLKIWDGDFSDRIFRIYRNSRFRLPPPAEKVGQAATGGGITDCRFIKNTNKSMVAE